MSEGGSQSRRESEGARERGKECVLVLRPRSQGFKNARTEIATVVRGDLGRPHANRRRRGKGISDNCLLS